MSEETKARIESEIIYMDMKIIKSEKRICSCCMEEHEVKTVLVKEHATFKNKAVDYEASYLFCDLAEEFYMDEQQIQDNDIRLKDAYLRKAIEASYAKFQGNDMFHGNAELSLDKVVDVIRYFAASMNVTGLYKVKLMKLMWYADALAYKRRGSAITGLVYQALPMGAVPVGHNSIIDLRNVPCEEVDMGETNAYHFSLSGEWTFPALSKEEKDILDAVIEKLGKMSKNDIVNFMHNEQAYIETAPRDIIQFKYAESLQIQ